MSRASWRYPPHADAATTAASWQSLVAWVYPLGDAGWEWLVSHYATWEQVRGVEPTRKAAITRAKVEYVKAVLGGGA